jgi:hypothetical protein
MGECVAFCELNGLGLGKTPASAPRSFLDLQKFDYE